MNRCVMCESSNIKESTARYAVHVGERAISTRLPAVQCGDCGESIVEGSAMETFEREVARLVATSGNIDGPTFKYLRKFLGLRAKELATKLGVTPETVSRWENGERDVDRLAWFALAMLVLDGPHATGVLEASLHPTTLPSTLPAKVA